MNGPGGSAAVVGGRRPATSDRPPTTGDWTIAIAPATRMPSLVVILLRVHGRASGRRCGRGANSCGGVWWCIRGGCNGGRGRPSIAGVPPICGAGNAGTGEGPAAPCYRGSGRLRRMVGAGAVRAIRVSRARMASAWRRSSACMRPGPCAKGRRRRGAHSRAGYGRRRGAGWGFRLGHSARACRASAHGNRTLWARGCGCRGGGRDCAPSNRTKEPRDEPPRACLDPALRGACLAGASRSRRRDGRSVRGGEKRNRFRSEGRARGRRGPRRGAAA